MTRQLAPALLAVPFLVLLAWLLVSLWAPSPGPGVQPQPAGQGDTPAAASNSTDWATRGRSGLFHTGLENLPASLAGTEVPDGLQVDADGNLVISSALRDVFDYFLSVLGEEDMDTVLARLRAYIHSQLPAGAAGQANQILNDYLALRDSLRDIPGQPAQPAETLDLDAVRAQRQAIRTARQQYLSAEADQAFFAAQDRWDDYGLARLEILQDDALDTADKAERLNALRSGLPGSMQQQVDAVLKYQDLQSLTRELRQQGGNEADLRLLREEVVGADAADRLEALEQERQAFDQRVQAWLQKRAAILDNTSLAAGDRQAQVESLRSHYFSDSELLRVQSLETVADRASR